MTAPTSSPPRTATLAQVLRRRSNFYDRDVAEFESCSGHGWHQPTAAIHPGGHRTVSVVIPARDMVYCLGAVLDALLAQDTTAPFEVIVVDDASCDGTGELAGRHPLGPTVIRPPRPCGAGTARNLGTAYAGGDVILYLDADMVLPGHAVGDVAARGGQGMVLVGFRHNVAYQREPGGRLVLPAGPADLRADHRVRWNPPVGTRLLYSGITLDRPVQGRPLEATYDLRDLGFARRYYDWDLPRMLVTAVVAVPRLAVAEVGGFHPGFAAAGWGSEDTYLGAGLIGAGLRVVPLRQLVGYHINPPDEQTSWQAKLATWPATIRLYHRLLEDPPPAGQTREFQRTTAALLRDSEVTP